MLFGVGDAGTERFSIIKDENGKRIPKITLNLEL